MKKPPTGRQHALALLKRFGSSGRSNTVLAEATHVTPFVTTLFYGVIERRITLDTAVRRYSNVAFDKIDSDTLTLLRVGLYQLYYMREAEHAVVSETVDLSPHRAKGFVNAVLRSAVRDREDFLAEINADVPPAATGDLSRSDISRLSVRYSFPQRLIRRWLAYLGRDTTLSVLYSAYNVSPLSVTLNPKYTYDELCASLKEDGLSDITRNAGDNYSFRACGRKVTELASYKAAYFHVQDVSSYECAMTVVDLLRDVSGKTVYDICSPPGGKAFTMAERGARVMACATTARLAETVLAGASRLGLCENGAGGVTVEINDGRVLNERYVAAPADVVLVDAPCSGFGTFRSKPEVKYKTDAEIAHLPQLQLDILETSAAYVKAGGRLVYSTCTLARAENEGVCEAFLSRNAGFVLAESRVVAPVGRDGFFTAVFARNG
ncbi:ribosomal RNA small subunit methyltransferase B [Clostridia bacterium]|nr:ribosomal RNA small subunit methyltransferase B [Clostridia bacterium]